MTFSAMGKQVLDGGYHYADARSDIAAKLIADALNAHMHDDCPVMPEIRTTEHAIRQENDEYACMCGARWDVRDGDAHP
jgi:hypothetical protein